MINEISQTATSWFYGPVFRVILIALIAIILHKIIKKFSKDLIKFIITHTNSVVDEKEEIGEGRVQTISNIFRSTSAVIIISIAVIMVLSEFGFDIKPILTGAGIIGLAVGFGSQSLVKDLVSGFFILIENQYDLGDRISLGNMGGTKVEGIVKGINLRRTTVCDDGGNLHIVPNGNISIVSRIKKAEVEEKK